MGIERKGAWVAVCAAAGVLFATWVDLGIGLSVVLVGGGIALAIKLSDEVPPFTALFVKGMVTLATGLILHQVPVMWTLGLLAATGWTWAAAVWVNYAAMVMAVAIAALWMVGGTSYYTGTPLFERVSRVGTEQSPVVADQRPATRRVVALNMEANSVWDL